MALLAILVVGAATVFAVATAFADNPTGSGYTIGDGIIGDIGTTFFPDPVGSVDELGPENGADTKLDVINTASPPMLDFTNVNGGVDLSGMWLDTNVDPITGDVWLYFAFSREAATTGQIAFEFERSPLPVACDFTNVSPIKNGNLTAAQSALIASCNPWKNRQAGDFMIVWDTQGNSTTLNKRNYSGTSFGSAQVIPANGYKVAVTADELKGEAAINLTTSGIFPASPTQCLTIANVKANTITGNSDQADFKDTILADTSGVGISNCGSVKILKRTAPAGGAGSFPYTLKRADDTAIRYSGQTTASETLTSDGDFDTISDLKTGTNYTLAETLAAGSDWTLQSISCLKDGNGSPYPVYPGNGTFPVAASTLTTCTITNAPTPRPDVSVAKSPDAGSVVVGESAVFSIVVTSTGNVPAQNVVVTDTLPAGTWVLGGADAASCQIESGVLTCNFATVSASKTVTLSRATTEADCAGLNNTASVTATGVSQKSDSGAIAVVCTPDLVISKSAGDTLVSKGDTATWTLVVTNNGTASATNVSVEDELPGGVDWATATVGCSISPDTTTGQTLTCSFETIGVGSQNAKTVTVTGTVPRDGSVCSVTNSGAAVTAENEPKGSTGNNTSGSATIDVLCPTISVLKSVSATGGSDTYGATATKPEPGGTFFFKVEIENTSEINDAVITDISDIVTSPNLGEVALEDLECSLGEDGEFPFTLNPGETLVCSFTRELVGNPKSETDHVDVDWEDASESSQEPESSNDAIIALTNVESGITVTKTANPTVVQDSSPVTFTVVVRNDSDVDTVYIETLTDSIYGNLNPRGTCTLEDGIDEGLSGSRRILPSASYTCSFTETVSKTETNVVTALGVDDDEREVSGSDDATVTVNRTPPPPYIPSTDISVTKAATPQVQLPQGGGTAAITYNLVVVNNGPDAAANVKVADTAPASVSFVSATTSAGTCTTTAQALDCTIVSLAPGASVAITINATVNATGTKANVVLVTTSTPETDAKNNQASAQTIVNAPLTPPKPPKPPVVKADICRTLVANPKMLKANGKAQRIDIKVTQGTKGVAGISVKITGPGISKTVISGKGGKVKVSIKPSQPGIIRLAIQGKKACNTQRIGVVGIFEPPVTG